MTYPHPILSPPPSLVGHSYQPPIQTPGPFLPPTSFHYNSISTGIGEWLLEASFPRLFIVYSSSFSHYHYKVSHATLHHREHVPSQGDNPACPITGRQPSMSHHRETTHTPPITGRQPTHLPSQGDNPHTSHHKETIARSYPTAKSKALSGIPVSTMTNAPFGKLCGAISVTLPLFIASYPSTSNSP